MLLELAFPLLPDRLQRELRLRYGERAGQRECHATGELLERVHRNGYADREGNREHHAAGDNR